MKLEREMGKRKGKKNPTLFIKAPLPVILLSLPPPPVAKWGRRDRTWKAINSDWPVTHMLPQGTREKSKAWQAGRKRGGRGAWKLLKESISQP